ncbi:MAG: type VII secretion integral membrane protein EccD [Aeromicrobium erythreum]
MLTTAARMRKVVGRAALQGTGDEGVDVLTAYSRVTVVTAERTIDLALPSGLPLADVLPQVMRYAAPEHDGGSPTTWSLGRVGGSTLSLAQTLADAGVLDGDVLELRSQADDASPALVEDVRDAVEDSVDAAGGVWVTRTTGSYAVLAGSAFLAAWGLVALLAGSLDGVGRLADLDTAGGAAVAVAALVLATWWADRHARAQDAQVAAGVAMLWGALLGRSGGMSADLDPVLVLALAAVVAVAVAGLARLLTETATGHLAFGTVVLVAVLVHAAVQLTPVPSGHSARLVPVLAILAVGVLPRVSLSVGGLASADYRVRHVGQLDLAALRRRYRTSNAILVGSLYGIGVAVVAAGVLLDVSGSAWDRTLAVALAVAALLRSRLFSRTQHVAPLRVAGLLVAAFALVRLAVSEPGTIPYLVPLTAVVLALGLGAASVPMSEITRARVKRTLNGVEFVAVVVTLVVAAGALGIYADLGGVV